jgi:hypothetical protein
MEIDEVVADPMFQEVPKSDGEPIINEKVVY